MPHVPHGCRVYAIGDIHGRADLLAELHETILIDAAKAPNRRIIVYLGDYVDRGFESREVINILLGRSFPGFEAIYLKGNHEAALLDFLADPRVGPGWFQFGGAATLASYQAGYLTDNADQAAFAAAQKEFIKRLPAAHLAFFRNLRLTHELGDYCFVHAGLRPGVALAKQTVEDLLWIRDDFLEHRGSFGHIVVHGHTITDTPEVRANRIGIDTGAYATGQLTCLVLEGTDRRFLST